MDFDMWQLVLGALVVGWLVVAKGGTWLEAIQAALAHLMGRSETPPTMTRAYRGDLAEKLADLRLHCQRTGAGDAVRQIDNVIAPALFRCEAGVPLVDEGGPSHA